MHSRDRPFHCYECGERFALKAKLTAHLKTHSDKPYNCEMCGNTFTTAREYNRHMSEEHKKDTDATVEGDNKTNIETCADNNNKKGENLDEDENAQTVLCDTVHYEDGDNMEVAQTEYVISTECE